MPGYNFTYMKYNFDDDEKFKDFVKSKLPKEGIPRNRYRQFMIKCETFYLKILNSSSLRRVYDIPNDWGVQFILE